MTVYEQWRYRDPAEVVERIEAQERRRIEAEKRRAERSDQALRNLRGLFGEEGDGRA